MNDLKIAGLSSSSCSPINGGSPNNLDFFYSAPSSPAPALGDDFSTPRFDDFEFETSKKFNDFDCFMEMEERNKVVVDYNYNKPNKTRELGGGSQSHPTMAFADELFVNGLVMPLKLKPPPRLQSQTIATANCSVPPSPTSRFKNPFVRRRLSGNDDFDPFIAALQKVISEENRGRRSSSSHHHQQHRRTRSHSPFRANKNYSEQNHRCNSYSSGGECNQLEDLYFETTFQINPDRSNSNLNNLPQKPQFKGSPYSRWVLDHTNQVQKISHKNKNMLRRRFTFVKSRVKPVKTDNQDNGETKMKTIKGILQKYASFRKENREDNEKTNQNSTRLEGSSFKYSYLKKLSIKLRGNSIHENGKKRAAITAEPKMAAAAVEYKRKKPTLALCFYGIENK